MMKFADRDHFLRIIETYGLNTEYLEKYGNPDGEDGKVSFPVPAEHSRTLPFAKFLLSLASPEENCMVMPTEWGIWPSSENWHLYETFRRSHLENTHLRERPCHCFARDEREVALDFVYLFLLFSWDFYVFTYKHEDILFISHDGFGTYYSPSRIGHLTELVFRDLPAELTEVGARN